MEEFIELFLEYEIGDGVPISGLGKMTIDVHLSREGDNIPHFHIYNKNLKSKKGHKYFSSAIMINDASFFDHGPHRDLLNKSQINKLLYFLNSVDDDGETMWIKILKAWNNSHKNSKVDITKSIPNYKEIITYDQWKSKNRYK